MDALQLFPGDLSRFRVEVVRLSRDHAFRRSGGARDFSGQSNAQSGREATEPLGDLDGVGEAGQLRERLAQAIEADIDRVAVSQRVVLLSA